MAWNIFISGLVLSFILLVPVGLKWEIERKVIIPAAFFIGFLAGAVANWATAHVNLAWFHLLALQTLVVGLTSTVLLLWRFYRDPDRVPPPDKNAILSPADGRVIYVKTIESGNVPFSVKKGRKFSLDEFLQSDLFSKGGYLIGIMMSYLDVHVNRAPITGRITLMKHIKGLFVSLKREEAILQNERVFTVIDEGHFKLGIVQIASRLVRKIVPFLQEGQEIQRGERLGIIRFGSQVDLILPNVSSLRVLVSPGDKVKAGLSIVARFDRT
jgi:phosphatidylserine decarboxylase